MGRIASCLLFLVTVQGIGASGLEGAPLPVFSDLSQTAPTNRSSHATAPTPALKLKTGIVVEVYQNEAWGMGWEGTGRGLGSSKTPMWSYKDGSRAQAPEEISPPEDWEWASPWQIDVSGRRESEGWDYARSWKELCTLDGHDGQGKDARTGRHQKGRKEGRDGRWGLSMMKRYRRRRWVRAMKPKRAALELDGDEALGALRKGEVTMDVASRAVALAIHEHAPKKEEGEDKGGEDGSALRRRLGVHPLKEPADLMLAPSLTEGESGKGRADAVAQVPPFPLPTMNPWASVRACWATVVEEFTFKGFGLSVVKPVFSGLLMRPDVGVGLKVPLTLHFPAYDRNERLPSISSAFMVFWPTAMQMSYSFSWPAELLLERYVKVCLRVLSGLFFASRAVDAAKQSQSPAVTQTAPRRDSVQRLGWSLGVRYSHMHGLQWWIAPFFFILPGVRLVSMFLTKVLETVDVMHAQVKQRQQMHLARLQEQQQKQFQFRWRQHLQQQQGARMEQAGQAPTETQPIVHFEAALALLTAVRVWAASKTSGLGYSLNYSGSRLGAAVIISFQPFFFNIDELLEQAAQSSHTASGPKTDGLATPVDIEEPAGERLVDALRSNDELLDLRTDGSGSSSTSTRSASSYSNSGSSNNGSSNNSSSRLTLHGGPAHAQTTDQGSEPADSLALATP